MERVWCLKSTIFVEGSKPSATYHIPEYMAIVTQPAAPMNAPPSVSDFEAIELESIFVSPQCFEFLFFLMGQSKWLIIPKLLSSPPTN